MNNVVLTRIVAAGMAVIGPAVAHLAHAIPPVPFLLDVTVDENGSGHAIGAYGGVPVVSYDLPATLASDPGPGGLNTVLTYALSNLSLSVAGDVIVTEASGSGGISDVIRFNLDQTSSDGSLLFYSSAQDGLDAPADLSSLPSTFYANTVTLPEVIFPDGSKGAIYTPGFGQPGFIFFLNGGVTYRFLSEVPEPSSLALVGAGLAALGLAGRRRGCAVVV